jgi:dephospho-CoA kinase
MKLFVLGLTGLRSCGKDTVAEYLKKNYDFKVLVFSDDILVPILKKMGKPATRINLIELATEMREKNGTDILAKMLAKKIKKGFFVISGIRFQEEVEYFRKKFGKRFKLIAIECDARKRYERAVKRAQKGEEKLSFEQFLEYEKLPTEMCINKTMEQADFHIENNGTIKDLYAKIDDLIKRIKI